MKNLLKLVIVWLFLSQNSAANNNNGFVDKYLFRKGISHQPLQLSADIYPFLFLAEGGGGSIGLEFSNWQLGFIGFGVVPPEFIKTNFFRNADDVTIRRNYAAEIFVNYFLRKDRKGLYFGLLGVPEWFYMQDDITKEKETIIKSYLVPRLGLRIFPFKKTF